MNNKERLKQEERGRERASKADRFWNAFQMTENGKVKSTLLLYSFCLSVVFLAVYVAAYGLLLGPLHAVVQNGPVLVVNLVEALVPAAVGAAVCSLACFLPEKRILPAAYLWLAALAAACLFTILFMLRGNGQAQALCLQFFLMFVSAPLLLGGGLAVFLYRRSKNRGLAEKARH